jgi:hypothetical protein
MVTIRLRPSLLVMLKRVRSAEATLDQGLTDVKQRCEDISRRLTRLGASYVEAGDPHEDDLANPDPTARIQAATRSFRHPSARTPLPERPGVNVTLTATWDIAARSASDVLLLVDQLRFDAAADIDPPEPPVEPPEWVDPAEQMQEFMARLTAPPPDDLTPQFLYIARLTDEQYITATSKAYQLACRRAERLTTAAGRRLSGLTSLMYTNSGIEIRGDRIVEQHRCLTMLGASSYQLQEDEVVSSDSRAVAVSISIHVTHFTE